MKVDTQKIRARIDEQYTALTKEDARRIREAGVFGLTVPLGELEALLAVYDAAKKWRDTIVSCREDRDDRDERFAEVIERVTR